MSSLFGIAQHCPNHIALQTYDETINFRMLEEKTNDLASKLQLWGKTILVLTAKPSVDFVIQCLAGLKSGLAVSVFPDGMMEVDKLKRLAILGNVLTIGQNNEIQEHQHTKNTNLHPEAALLMFTSGSHGEPKVVQLSQQNILANCEAVIESLQFNTIKNQALFLPLSYSFGLLGQLLPGLLSGITTHLLNHFMEIKNVFETENIPEMWSGVPSHWVAISKMAALYPHGAEGVKALVSAGAPLPIQLRDELHKLFPNAILYNNYGLTEASPRVLSYSSRDSQFMENYAGYPIGDWEVKLSQEHELLIRGKQMMLGYLDGENQSKIHDGWLSTGDIAEISPNGLIAIKGRIDNTVNIGGEKIITTEIEQVVCQLEGINEAVVLPSEDAHYGTGLTVYLEKSVLKTLKDIRHITEAIKQQLLPRKLPIKVHVLDSFPRNRNDKINRKSLLDLHKGLTKNPKVEAKNNF